MLIPVALEDRDQPRGFEDEIPLVTLGDEAVRRAARDHHVVARLVREVAEDRLDRPRALVHEYDLVALPVPEEVVHRLARAAQRDLDVVVPHEEPPSVDRVARRRAFPRAEVAMCMRIGHPLLAHDRLELAELDHAARRLEVVEDRLEPREALEPHHLFGEKCPVVAEHDVSLPRKFAETLIERHAWRISPGGSSARSSPGPA